MPLLENVYLCIYSSGLEEIPDMTSILKVIELYDKYEIAFVDSYPEWRNEILEHYSDIESEERYAVSFDPTTSFKKFMNNIFQAMWYKSADEEWKKAGGDSFSVGLIVQKGENQDLSRNNIKSTFIVLRLLFTNENVKELMQLFKKRFDAKYKEFLRDVQKELKGMLALGTYEEMPSEL